MHGVGGERAAARVRAEHLEVERRLLVELYARVEAADVVALVGEVVGRREEADEILPAHVALEAKDADGRILADDAVARRRERFGVEPLLVCEVARRIVRREEEAVGVAAPLASELSGDVGVNDRARVDGGDERAEDVYAFEEERSLLFEEDREALVRRVDGRVGLDLCEVGVNGEVYNSRRRHDKLRRQAGVNFDGLVDERALVCQAERAGKRPAHRAYVLARLRDGEARYEFDCALGRDVFEARDVPRLIEQPAYVARDGHP